MSHFSCLVIGSDVETKLAPYDENLEVEEYKVPITDKEIDHMVEAYSMHEDWKDLDRNDIQAIAAEWKDWCSYEMEFDEKGKPFHRSTDNKKPQWDWWVIGGRWQGMLRLKHSKEGEVGEFAVLAVDPEYRPGWVDQAKFGDIDWQYMRNNPEQLLDLKLEWMQAVTGELPLRKPQYYLDRYGTEKEFIRRNMKFSTFTVLTDDGKWHQVGEMLYWGMSTESNDEQRDWTEGFWETFLEGLDPETLITVTDCHI